MSFSILGTGSALPSYTLTNDKLATMVDTSDEWISTRTGIKERRVCTNETATELAAAASSAALESAGVTAGELDLIICATVTADYIFPSLACTVQKEIGALCPAFDVSAACTGFIYALDIAAGYFARKPAAKILVIGCDIMSRVLDWSDRATCVLFGDGCGAAVLGEGNGLLSIKLAADGNTEFLIAPNLSGKCPLHQHEKKDSSVVMKGQDVFKFAVGAMCRDLAEVIADAGLSQEDIDYVLPHQANLRIIDAAKNRLTIPAERYVINIDRYGNTSAATIPLLLDELDRAGKLKSGDILAMAAFGAGLTSGACILRWK